PGDVRRVLGRAVRRQSGLDQNSPAARPTAPPPKWTVEVAENLPECLLMRRARPRLRIQHPIDELALDPLGALLQILECAGPVLGDPGEGHVRKSSTRRTGPREPGAQPKGRRADDYRDGCPAYRRSRNDQI